MKGYSVYNAIQQLKERGFKKASVARPLNLNRRTVIRYWDMPVEEYEQKHLGLCREKALDAYREQIIGWLKPIRLSRQRRSAIGSKALSEQYSERTVSRYVKALREEYQLKKSVRQRVYEAVPELPMGQQMQVDFGQMSIQNVDGGWTKVYVAAFLLSHFRYKYAEMQNRPFTAVDLVHMCHNCFHYIGGMPQEMVFDQDSIVCVSKNAGDVIYTYEFEKFRQECKMSIYMCRGAAPERKGKIENTVKYIKGNFLSNRLYVDDGILNGSCLD